MLRFAIVLLAAVPVCAQVKITAQGKDKVAIEIDGKPFTDFYVGPQASKPYLHPLRTADGKSVTRGYPMIPNVPGESHDHPHHKGLWFAHGDVNGYNFWAGDPEVPLDPKFKGRGKIVLERISKISNGKTSGSVTGTFLWNTSDGQTLLVETRTMTFYSDPVIRQFDFDATLSPQEEVTFGDTKEGMFAIRVATGLNDDHERAEQDRGEGHVGEAIAVGGYFGTDRRSDLRDCGAGSSIESAVPDLLARARVRAVGGEHFRGARFRERSFAPAEPDDPAGAAAAVPVPGDYSSERSDAGRDTGRIHGLGCGEVGAAWKHHGRRALQAR